MALISLSIQEAAFDAGSLQDELFASTSGSGCIVSFTGYVRELDSSKQSVTSLYLEHYPGMTDKAIKEILSSACKRWEIEAISVVHRVGFLLPRHSIVWVGASAPHRSDAFSACEFSMDYLKTRAPFWKKEETESGRTWIDSNASDTSRAERWDSKPSV